MELGKRAEAVVPLDQEGVVRSHETQRFPVGQRDQFVRVLRK